MNNDCECDIDAPCDVPECVAIRDAERARYEPLQPTGPALTRDEWESVYQHRPGKAASFERLHS